MEFQWNKRHFLHWKRVIPLEFPLDSSGKIPVEFPLDSVEITLDFSGIPLDSSGNSNGIPLDSSGNCLIQLDRTAKLTLNSVSYL